MEKEIDNLGINYEMILAEDGSTDNTKKILNNLITKDEKKIF